MTGEMSNPVNRSEWPMQDAIRRAVGGQLRAFDVYLGPYIKVDEGKLFYSEEEDAGLVVLWPQGIAPALAESLAVPCVPGYRKSVMNAALEVLRVYRKQSAKG